MQCKDVEAVLENEGFSPLPEAARAHVASCGACRTLVEDFSTIVSLAEQLPAEVEPPTRVWVSLRNQLEAEGIIKTPAEAPVAPQTFWWRNFERIFHGRAIAAALGLAIVAAFIVQIERTNHRPGPAPTNSSKTNVNVVAEAPAQLQPQLPPPTINESLGKTGEELGRVEQNEVRVVQQAGLGSQNRVDISLSQNLKSLNQFIDECQRRLKEDPNDELAREYLSVAYQQKAELLSAMLDRGRSVN